jgi:hypothetical protein
VDGTIGQWLGANSWAHLVWGLLVVAFFHVVLTRTRWGLHTIAVGADACQMLTRWEWVRNASDAEANQAPKASATISTLASR